MPIKRNNGSLYYINQSAKGTRHDKTEEALLKKGLSVGWQELSRYLSDLLHNTGLSHEKLKKMDEDDQMFGRL